MYVCLFAHIEHMMLPPENENQLHNTVMKQATNRIMLLCTQDPIVYSVTLLFLFLLRNANHLFLELNLSLSKFQLCNYDLFK